MTPKGLIAIGLVWLVAVALWVCFFDKRFSLVWMAPSSFKMGALIVGFYVCAIAYLIFLIGWLVPMGVGLYRFVRHL